MCDVAYEPLVTFEGAISRLAALPQSDRTEDDFATFSAALAILAAPCPSVLLNGALIDSALRMLLLERPLCTRAVSCVSHAYFLLARCSSFRECVSPETPAALLSCLQSPTAGVSATRHICDALANLCVDPRCQRIVAEGGGIPLLVAGLALCADDPDGIEAACCALQNVADYPPNQITIGRAGGVSGVVGALTRHATSAAVAGAACGALRNLADCAENHTRLITASAVSMLLSALSLHSGDAVVVEAACGALQSLAEAGQRRAVVYAGALPAIAAALSALIPLANCGESVAHLVSLLASLVNFGRGKGAPAHEGVMQHLLVIVRESPLSVPDGSSTRVSAWQCLWFLSRVESNCIVMHRAGLLDDMLAALRVREFAAAAVSTLNNVTLNSAAARREKVTPDIVLAVAASLHEFGADDAQTTVSILMTLWGVYEWLHMVVAILNILPTLPPLVPLSFHRRADWLSAPDLQGDVDLKTERLLAAGFIGDLHRSLSRHMDDADVAETAAGFTQCFLSGSPPAKSALADSELLPLLVGSVAAHPANEGIADLVCATLLQLAVESAFIPRVLACGGQNCSRDIIARFPCDSDAAKAARRLGSVLRAASSS